jgi:hypothetical protein
MNRPAVADSALIADSFAENVSGNSGGGNSAFASSSFRMSIPTPRHNDAGSAIACADSCRVSDRAR